LRNIALQNVVSDPVISRPVRQDLPSSRAASAARESTGSFDAMLDSTPGETPPPRNDRPARTETRSRASDDRDETRAEPSRSRDTARDTDRSPPASEPDQSKSAGSAPTRQAKNGQSSDTPNKPAKGSDKASADDAEAAPDAPPPAPAQATIDPAKAAEAALVEAEGAAAQVAGDPKTDKTTKADAETGTADGNDPQLTAQGSDAKPADPAAVIVAVAVPTTAPATPGAASDPTADNVVAAAAAKSAAPAVTAPETTPAVPTGDAAAPDAPKPDAAGLGGTDADPKAPARDAAPKLAAAAAAQAGAKADPTAETPQIAGAKVQVDADEPKSPLERKADGPKAKATAPERIQSASDARPADTPNAAPAQTENQSPEPQAKAATAHQPQHHAAELAAVTRAASAESRADSAAAATTASTTASTASAAATPNTPVLPFGLQVSSALVMPTQPMALRTDASDTAVPISGLAVEIVSKAQDGNKRFDIRLDPPELGRIDVRLDVDQGGKVTSRLVVERADTLDLLRRDAPQLERALQQAGLNTDGGLQFSLRDQSFAGRDQSQNGGSNVSQLIIPDDEQAASEAARRGYGRLIGLGGGVDIRV
jgi:flagellar hook-length control protein FliK